METRKLLSISVIAIGLVGLAFAAVPFIYALKPSRAVQENARLVIDLDEVPAHGALETTWRNKAVFVVKMPEPKAFLFPRHKKGYGLPDTTWGRPLVPCAEIQVDISGFTWADPELSEFWLMSARWDRSGKSLIWMPDLLVAPYTVAGNNVVLMP